MLTVLFHEVANFSSSSSVSSCLSEHAGTVPPPNFRDVCCLFLFTCWPTPQNKTSFLRCFSPSADCPPRKDYCVSARMVSYPGSVMCLRTLGFVLAACCFVMSCHPASGESKSLSRFVLVHIKHLIV